MFWINLEVAIQWWAQFCSAGAMLFQLLLRQCEAIQVLKAYQIPKLYKSVYNMMREDFTTLESYQIGNELIHFYHCQGNWKYR